MTIDMMQDSFIYIPHICDVSKISAVTACKMRGQTEYIATGIMYGHCDFVCYVQLYVPPVICLCAPVHVL